ncbi:Werner Syndrome-like exonuclease [Ricinus communis]|uniref:3-5 exonuclease, putative n=1 Tax=Ricinus communis TaxID=3988 RepID=B9SNW3_RICCO|nr:Werner Syndrome-like exonuclease [Ricinus communis]EEF34681.1 3-5 exonuclease, putative [Ricinus communis]|eukprot:XP_002527682.1 Werner Syndrome-like exonuclease [Ricinus communis]
MTLGIRDYELINDTHNLYDITFFTDQIHTLVTHSPSLVEQWLIETQGQNNQTQPTIVGLDVEWRPNFSRHIENPVATLQLCIGSRCLIYQLIHSPRIPQSLFDFLKNSSYVFAGVGIESDVEKLVEDYGLSVGNVMELRRVAAESLGVKELKNAGLKELVKQVLGKEIQKPKRVTMSRWDSMWLSHDQVQYACLDAFVCSEIGRILTQSGP